MPERLGLIAGNGRFPFLILDAARSRGYEVVVAAIKEETFPEIEQHGAASVHWMSLGELTKLIETFQREGVKTAVMAGQVKHKQIFSAIRPDWKLAKLLLALPTRNTDSLIGAVAKVLEDEGIHLMSSTALLEPLLAREGVLTKRRPSDQEQTNITYGRSVAQHLSRFDIGQTVVIAEAACVAVEAIVRKKRIVAIKNVTVNEPFFTGHFPDYPIMPGVLIVEAVAQAGAALLLTEIPDRSNKLTVFTGIERAKFRKPVVPGDQLRIEVDVIVWRATAVKMQGRTFVDGQLACEAIVTCQLVPRKSESEPAVKD